MTPHLRNGQIEENYEKSNIIVMGETRLDNLIVEKIFGGNKALLLKLWWKLMDSSEKKSIKYLIKNTETDQEKREQLGDYLKMPHNFRGKYKTLEKYLIQVHLLY